MANLPSILKKIFHWKTLLLVSTLGGVLLILAILALPWWLGWALKQAPAQAGLSFDSYSMEGYGRFQMTGVKIEQPGARVVIDQLEAPSPLNWLRLAWWSADGAPGMVINHGEVVLTESEEDPESGPAESSPPQDIMEAMQLLEKYLPVTDRWLPKVEVNQLTLIRDERQANMEGISWNQRRLTLTGVVSPYPGYPFNLAVDLSKGRPAASLEIPGLDLSTRIQLQDSGQSWSASGSLSLQGNDATFTAALGQGTWIPESADWNFPNWALELSELGWSYDAYYQNLQLDLRGEWENGRASNRVSGHLSPPENPQNPYLVPIDFQTEVGGNDEAVSVTRFTLEAPGIRAEINEPVRYDFRRNLVTGDLRFDMDLDLSSLNIAELEGRLTGLMEITTSDGKPTGKFNLAGSAIRFREFAFESLGLEADLDWPLLILNRGTARQSNGSFVEASGVLDIESRSVSNGDLEGSLVLDTLQPFLPEGMAMDGVTFTTILNGPWNALEHSGNLEAVNFETGFLHPVAAQVNWSAKSMQFEALDLTATLNEAALEISAAGNLGPGDMQWRLDELILKAEESNQLTLASPANLQISPGSPVRLSLEEFRLMGGDSSVSIQGQLAYPASGDLKFSARQIDTGLWTNTWLKQPLPALELVEADGRGMWNQGPLEFDIALDGAVEVEGNRLIARGRAASEAKGVSFTDLELADSKGPWIEVSGLAPVQIIPDASPMYTIDKQSPIALSITTSESKNWIDWLSGLTPFSLDTFDSKVVLEGSLSQLKGSFDLGITTQQKQEEHGMPSARIQARGGIDQSVLTLSSMEVSVQEEQFSISGSLNLPDAVFDLLDHPASKVPWEETVFDLMIPPSKLSPMRYFFPQLLSTGGVVEANLQGGLEAGIAGYIRIKEMNTRAVFPFGSVRNLSADLEFEQSLATLNNISGDIGREPITISGSLDYRNWKKPTYQFTVSGEDIPLLRKPGLLLRSDLDLSIDNSGGEGTLVSGEVVLKDGLYLLNRNTLFTGGSGGGRSATTRPPFFSVDIPPLSEWELDVVLKGDEFIRVRTPAADGTLSLNMKLQGKLREPFATGQLEYVHGNLFFPFASFEVDYGLAELRVDNPYVPLIEVIGTSRRFGYDLTVEITGSAYDPQVHFTSNPPLSSEQIMLMVMTGNNPEGMFDYEATQRVSRWGSYLSKGLFTSGGTESNFFSRLSMTSGENLSEQGKETMDIEYRLNDQFQVVGEYDEYDFWNVGINWRILERHLKDPREGGKNE